MHFAKKQKLDMANHQKISISIAYANKLEQMIHQADVQPGISIQEALCESGFKARYPNVTISNDNIGVFGRRVPNSYQLKHGDRIEIYRPLAHDPKELRLMRIKKYQS